MRDFFYNKSDVLIAVVIILAAAFVIYTRVGVIMDYPGGESDASVLPKVEELLDSAAQLVTGGGESADAVAGEEQPAQAPDSEAQPSAAEAEPSVAEESPVSETPQDQTQPAAQETSPSPASAQITVNAGDAASVIADKLVAVGAIADKQAFLSEVVAQGADSKLKMGTFIIPAGSSVPDIIKILVG